MTTVEVIESLANQGRKVSETRLERLTDKLDQDWMTGRITNDRYEQAHRLLDQLDGER